MPFLLLKDLPRYECLLEGAKEFPDLDPSACEAYLNLLLTGDEVVAVREHLLSEHTISQGRFSVLMILWQSEREGSHADLRDGELPESQTPAKLADAGGVTRATMTGLIDTLERDDLVRREPSPTDRRMMTVELTAEGKGLIKKLLPGYFNMMSSLMEPLSNTERKTLVLLLNKIQKQVTSIKTESESV